MKAFSHPYGNPVRPFAPCVQELPPLHFTKVEMDYDDLATIWRMSREEQATFWDALFTRMVKMFPDEEIQPDLRTIADSPTILREPKRNPDAYDCVSPVVSVDYIIGYTRSTPGGFVTRYLLSIRNQANQRKRQARKMLPVSRLAQASGFKTLDKAVLFVSEWKGNIETAMGCKIGEWFVEKRELRANGKSTSQAVDTGTLEELVARVEPTPAGFYLGDKRTKRFLGNHPNGQLMWTKLSSKALTFDTRALARAEYERGVKDREVKPLPSPVHIYARRKR